MNTIQAKNDVGQITTMLDSLHIAATVKMISPIAGSASARRYYRIEFDDDACDDIIATFGTVERENEAFLYLARHFGAMGFRVPRVLASAPGSMAYLQSDVGRRSLYSLLAAGDSRAWPMALDVVAQLPRFQFEGARGLEWNRCFPVAEVTERSLRWDLNYFKYDFLKVAGIEVDDLALEDDFDRLVKILTDPRMPVAFQVRDFQTRNLMVDDCGNCSLIDFQGGRRGNTLYDVASFAWQTRARFSPGRQAALVEAYYNALQPYHPIDRRLFDNLLQATVLLRQLQVLGAYGLRGMVQGKPGFTETIALTLDNLLTGFTSPLLESYPALKQLIGQAQAAMAARGDHNESFEPGVLTIDIASFSYKRGYPADPSGNGGGFVFDCRWMANPGRYAEYKLLSGRDRPVIEFLDRAGEIDGFAERCEAIVVPAIDNYLERGFSHMSVAFGCTGGQHRSLRSADLLAGRLARRYAGRPVVLRVSHREQSITEEIDLSVRFD